MKNSARYFFNLLILLLFSVCLSSGPPLVSASEATEQQDSAVSLGVSDTVTSAEEAAEQPAYETIQGGTAEAAMLTSQAEALSGQSEAVSDAMSGGLTAGQPAVLPTVAAAENGSLDAPEPVPSQISQSVMMPAYRYANQGDEYWSRIAALGGGQIPYVIINPNSGPGTEANPDFSRQIAENINAGIQNIAYVKTDYFNRSLADITADVDRYAAFYGAENIAGIFFDEAGSGTNPNDLQVMADLYAYVKNTYPNMTVIANPGRTITDDISAYADIWLTSELSAADYINNYPQPQSDFERDPANANRIFHVIYEADPSQYDQLIELSRTRNTGWLMITDDRQANPYDALPTDFESLISRINTANRQAANPADIQPLSAVNAATVASLPNVLASTAASALLPAGGEPIGISPQSSSDPKADTVGTAVSQKAGTAAAGFSASAGRSDSVLPKTGETGGFYLILSGVVSLIIQGFIAYRFRRFYH
ncbi:LPXTG cell wall anchor domain-containing protein [Streptococcus chenjunshii]|uniref:LPXTG cell wall anchor domain-containing protein n=1 Tax=Streptococcus chenjunshii TaxID=2173853 RepID=A0A372KJB9_9STRE|nr:spherulation-specific family 4 protein [Streptococcus chenjunshii]AXQ78128.1 LPXTG cell wall anchor domain-containing protein [Streptococcus chenjunshii]RFU50166.1 LPXTG cell wall anchor domain-containing protein [Streptococcus chenjunshii]RFU52343.1 LPXTG cell wall anchor domain-containing protein [Streptococcus chenjunshii]